MLSPDDSFRRLVPAVDRCLVHVGGTGSAAEMVTIDPQGSCPFRRALYERLHIAPGYNLRRAHGIVAYAGWPC